MASEGMRCSATTKFLVKKSFKGGENLRYLLADSHTI